MIAQNLKTVLATAFHFYLKSHKFHWNVIGTDFAQQHEFLGAIANEVYGSIDTTAEIIRTCGELAPGSFQEYLELSQISDPIEDDTNGQVMFEILASDNETLLQLLAEAYQVAESEMAFDISDFLAGRIAAHKKHAWMLASFLNRQA